MPSNRINPPLRLVHDAMALAIPKGDIGSPDCPSLYVALSLADEWEAVRERMVAMPGVAGPALAYGPMPRFDGASATAQVWAAIDELNRWCRHEVARLAALRQQQTAMQVIATALDAVTVMNAVAPDVAMEVCAGLFDLAESTWMNEHVSA